MASFLLPPLYVVALWWLSTGAVLLLVSRSGGAAKAVVVGAASLAGAACLLVSRDDASSAGAYTAFTGTLLLWAAQEIAFLAGWVTGPQPHACTPGLGGWPRLRAALRAILYHELALLACGGAVVLIGNPMGLAAFAALWVLRQSAKINLFLGVPVTNDALLPPPVKFLASYFRRAPVGGFFPLSVTLATAALVIMVQRLVEVAVTPFEVTGRLLVVSLFALGVVEHWFMLLPLPAVTLWGWGMRRHALSEEIVMTPPPDAKPAAPPLMIVEGGAARQRLEDEFRRRFREQNSAEAGELSSVAASASERTA